MNTDGSNLIRLHSVEAWFKGFSWSPDGTRIAFADRPDGTNSQIYVIDADGRNPIRLTSKGHNMNPSWSPDGERIAFVSLAPGPSTYLYVMDTDGSNVTELSEVGPNEYPLKWSPDGSRIAFTYSNKPFDITFVHVVDANSGKLVWQYTEVSCCPSWSPDGKQIAFDSSSGIYIASMDGGDPTKLTQDMEHCGFPFWLPNKDRIAFTRFYTRGAQNPDNYVVDSDENNLLKLVNINATAPVWSPDGTRIAFVPYGGERGIHVVNADGSSLRNLTEYVGGFAPSWSP